MIAIILPTDACNLRCSYCTAKHGMNIMSKDTLINSIAFSKEVFDYENNGGHWEWHAGEPLLLPISYYKYAEELFTDINFDYKRIFCTNLIPFNQEWLDFCIEYNYNLSTSLDGPQYVHDRNRGIGTFETVIENVLMMKKQDFKFGCIAVLSEYSCDHAIDVYEFFRDHNIDIKLNVQVPNTFHEKTHDALIKMFDAWWNDHVSMRMQPFNKMIDFFLGKGCAAECSTFCNHGVFCINTVGDVYPCERFESQTDLSRWCFGNVNHERWEDIWFGDKRQRFLEFVNMPEQKCFSCDYIDYCGGGCSYNSILHNHCDVKKGIDCDITKSLLNHISQEVGWLKRI